MKKFLLFLLSIAMLFFSCSNISHDDGSSDRDSADGGTYLVIRSTSVNRTVVPSEEDAGLGALKNLVLMGTRTADSKSVPTEETEQTLATEESYAALSDKRIELQTGYWSFTLSADLNGIAFSDTVTNKLIEEGKENEISFNLSVAEGFGGGLGITLKFTDASNQVTSAKATLTSMDENPTFTPLTQDYESLLLQEDESGDMVYTIDFTRSITEESSRIPDGTYKLVFDFYVEGYGNLEPIPYIVRIADGITTTYTDRIKLNETYTITYKIGNTEITAETFADPESGIQLVDGEVWVTKYSRKSGEIKLPKMKRAGYVFGGWFIKQGVAGDFKKFVDTISADSSSGVVVNALWYDPEFYVSAEGKSDNEGYNSMTALDSIATALKKIEQVASSDGPLDWTIYVSGQLSGTTEISSSFTTEHAKSLTLAGLSENTMPDGSTPDVTDYTDILDGASVYYEDKSSAIRNGSVLVIRTEVPVTIRNLKITNGIPTAQGENGGGIYNTGNVTLDSGAWISGNYSYEYGGGIYNGGTLTMKEGSYITNNRAYSEGTAVYNAGSFIMEGGEISSNMTLGTDIGATVQHHGDLFSISGSAYIPAGAEGVSQHIKLPADSPFSAYQITVGGTLTHEGQIAAIKVGSFTDKTDGKKSGYANCVILKNSDDSALTSDIISKFSLVQPESGTEMYGTEWYIDEGGKLILKTADASGNVTISNNALNISLTYEPADSGTEEFAAVINDALASETPTLPLNTAITLAVKDSSGNNVTDATVDAKILYHGNTIPTGYTLEDGVLNVSTTMPKVTSDACQLYVTATKGTVTSSQTFEVKFGGFYTGSASELGSFDMLASGASTTIPLYISITGTGDLATVAGSLSGKSNKIYLDLSGMTDVTAVGAEVFDSCSGIVSLVLPEGTTTIVSNALQGLSNLEEITLPETVSVIEDGAFPAYNKINKITLAGENKTFAITDDGAILLDNSGTIVLVAQASGITTLDFSGSPLSAVTKIPAYAFLGVESLTTVSDFGNVTDIGDGGFYGAGLTGNLDLSDITSIGSMAFAGCKNLTGITLNSIDTVTIARQAFYGAGLTELYLPATTDFTPTEVDDSDPEHIRYTYNQAFYTCKSLKTVKIAADFSRELNASMFERCSNLENFVIDETNERYSTACDGALLIQSGSYLICAAQGGIPATIDFSSSELSGITNIERAAFAGDENLKEEERTSFAVANFGSVTTIVEEAFKASGITSVADFGLVCDIGDYAFSYTPLASIPPITEDMKVGSFAFYSTKLAEVTIASPKITINGSAFGSSLVKKVTLDFEIDYNDTTDYSEYIPTDANNLTNLCSQEYFINRYILSSWCGLDGINELVLNKKVTLRDYSYDSEDERYTPTTVEMTVGSEKKTYHVERPFETFMESLETLTFKGAGSSVGEYQFHGFSKLKTVNLSGVKYIYDYAFANSGLGGQPVTILDSVVAIGNCAFLNDSAVDLTLEGTGTWWSNESRGQWTSDITEDEPFIDPAFDWAEIGTVNEASAAIINKIAVTEAPSTAVWLFKVQSE